jgi:hypothetical protein
MNMKKTISILILLILIPTLCFAGALQEKQRQVIAKKNTAGCSDGSYNIMQQEFEGSTNCLTSSQPYCDNSVVPWDVKNGTPNWNYTDGHLRGSRSLLLDPTSDAVGVNSATFTDASEIWGHFRLTALPSSGETTICYFRTSADASMMTLAVMSDGKLDVSHGSTGTQSSAGVVAINTTYHVWIRYKAGSGANGLADIYIGTSGTRNSATHLSITNGDATGSIGILRLQAWPQTTTNFIYDQIYLSTTEITNVCD